MTKLSLDTPHDRNRLWAGAAVAVIAVWFVFLTVVRGQTDQTNNNSLPSFEVASVKPNNSGTANRSLGFVDPSRMRITNVPVKFLIQFAYHVQPFQISGGPSWINSQGYDIDAKVDDSVVAQLQKLPPEERMDQFRQMLQSLLLDRFKLKLDHETRQLSTYDLVIAKGGPKVTPTTLPQQPPAANAKEQSPRRGIAFSRGTGTTVQLVGTDVGIAPFLEALTRQPELEGRTLVDKTGLTGRYDFKMHWTREDLAQQGNDTNGNAALTNAPLADSTGPSLFTALREQLGLKLESRKGPVDVLVIDHIESPSAN